MQEKNTDDGKIKECKEFKGVLEANDPKEEARDPGAARHGNYI